jgi:hypothetical protein
MRDVLKILLPLSRPDSYRDWDGKASKQDKPEDLPDSFIIAFGIKAE